MKICIIDIGTQSIKHSIFEVEGTQRTLLLYKKYSEANLGEEGEITDEATERNINILQGCILSNQTHGVEKVIITGTDILRNAKNADIFMARVVSEVGYNIQIVSHQKEAELLYTGLNIIAPGMSYVGLNVGGGSTEIVCVREGVLEESIRMSFGVKAIREKYIENGMRNWELLDAYLDQIIVLPPNTYSHGFITGVFDFTNTIVPHLQVPTTAFSLPNHPFFISFQDYESYVSKLRIVSLDTLCEWYTKDPKFCDNVAFGQSIYLAILRKMSVKYVLPSNNDLTDGLIVDYLKQNQSV